ncbi:MAG: VanZ family protein [bacterium]
MIFRTEGGIKYFVPAILYAALIFGLSALPSSAIPDLGISSGDLFMHFGEYTIFGYFLGMAAIQTSENANWKRVLLGLIIGSLYAASDEYHQSFVAGRVSEVSDFIADTVGVMFGMYLFLKLLKRGRRDSRRPPVV